MLQQPVLQQHSTVECVQPYYCVMLQLAVQHSWAQYSIKGFKCAQQPSNFHANMLVSSRLPVRLKAARSSHHIQLTALRWGTPPHLYRCQPQNPLAML